MMEKWAQGDFIADWQGEPKTPELNRIPIKEQPDALTRAALEACIGGPFFPGIECTYLAAQPQTYEQPFRIQQTFPPGYLTERMALPWQADFLACAKEQFGGDATGTRAAGRGLWPWKKEIKESAVQSFYAFFNSELPTEEEKKYGSMSAREYRAQRKYADSFPTITYEEIQKRMKQLEIDLTQPLDVDLGDDDGN